MTIQETVDILIKHSVCLRHMSICDKNCSTCTVSVQDKKLLEAYDVALDALAICSSTEPYQRYVEKGA